MKLQKEVVNGLKPTEEEARQMNLRVCSFLDKLNKRLSGATAIIGGSVAKGTWLKGTSDADVFVQFDYEQFKEKDNQISEILEKTLQKAFGAAEKLHGSRDYYQIKQGNFVFEIVPILKIKNAKHAKNITDISPLHAKWVRANIKDKADEVRLAKAFCRANDCYGAESYIKGFSGYVCEILIIHYGSFTKLLNAAVKWKPKETIDPAGYYKRQNALMRINKSKTQSPVIIVDPVQADRNAAAALSSEKLEKFRKAAAEFIKKPDKKFFEKEELTIEKIKKSTKHKLIIIEAQPAEGKEDVVGSKLLKAKEYIEKKLEESEFEPIAADWQWDGKAAIFWYAVGKAELPANQEKQGPPLKAEKNVKDFKKKHKKTFTRKNRVYAIEKRQFVKPEELIASLKKDSYLKEKIKSLKLIK